MSGLLSQLRILEIVSDCVFFVTHFFLESSGSERWIEKLCHSET